MVLCCVKYLHAMDVLFSVKHGYHDTIFDCVRGQLLKLQSSPDHAQRRLSCFLGSERGFHSDSTPQ